MGPATPLPGKIKVTGSLSLKDIGASIKEAMEDTMVKRKEKAGSEVLERRLQFLIAAISEIPDLKLELKVGNGCSCAVPETKTMEVWQKDHESEECVMGKAYHEVAHILFTKRLPDDILPKGEIEKRILHMQFNSLEDYRIEYAMPLYFQASDFYIKTMNQEMFGSNDWEIEQFRDPMFNLHFLLGGFDMVKFLPEQKARRAVRKAAEYLNGVRFKECKSSEELWPHVLKVFEILKPYYRMDPDEEKDEPQFSGMKGVPNPRFEIVDKDSGTPSDESGEDAGGDDEEEGTEGEGKGEKKPKWKKERKRDEGPGKKDEYKDTAPLGRTILEVPKTKHWVKPMPVTVRTISQTNTLTSSEPITDMPNIVSKGKALGRTLKRELKLKEEAEHRRSSGKLDIRELRRQLVQHGEIISPKVFMRDTHNKYAHTVSILIDFSGSMGEYHNEVTKLKAAKSAALMLASCLEEMHVQHSVAGFSAVEGALEIVHYDIKPFASKLSIPRLQEFNFTRKPVALQNRDSDSVRHAVKLLKSYGKGTKVLFVISDGQPHHPDGVKTKRKYNYGYNSRADMIKTIKEAEQMGIQVIGIAIEPEAAEFINQTYKKGFHIGDIDELPQRLLNIYRRVIRPIMG